MSPSRAHRTVRRTRIATTWAIAATALVAGCTGAASTAPSAQPSIAQPPSSSAAQSAASNPSPAAPPALTETFTSARNGITVSYPAGWVVRPEEQSWAAGFPSFSEKFGDFIYDPARDDHLFLSVASQPLAGRSGAAWAAGILEMLADPCGTGSEPVTIGGTGGVIGLKCSIAVTSSGDRGYLMWLYTSADEGWLDSVYDRAWFKDILATVKLAGAGS